MPNLPLCHWSSQLFNLPTPSSTDVPVLLLNQPNSFNGHFDKICHTTPGHALCMALTILLLSFGTSGDRNSLRKTFLSFTIFLFLITLMFGGQTFIKRSTCTGLNVLLSWRFGCKKLGKDIILIQCKVKKRKILDLRTLQLKPDFPNY